MKNKQWYDDYYIQIKPYWNGKAFYEDRVKQLNPIPGEFIVKLPYSYSKKEYIYTAKSKRQNEVLFELVSLIDCLLHELTERDKKQS